ncbi:hypothetical protein [Cupriavidus oxalaticus]|uniref:Uncharacterized protein n=2 Tax=Cupriavidus TaxID=106589 RepID=A0A4P7LB25_9BURK|nr:hypothetical protein [Cupriavidus oxalaticus]QBY53134.1 hypothetical protein E0W60_18650 [Cupriavidus oxalaticus]
MIAWALTQRPVRLSQPLSVVGVGPGSGLMVGSADIMQRYGLEAAGYQLKLGKPDPAGDSGRDGAGTADRRRPEAAGGCRARLDEGKSGNRARMVCPVNVRLVPGDGRSASATLRRLSLSSPHLPELVERHGRPDGLGRECARDLANQGSAQRQTAAVTMISTSNSGRARGLTKMRLNCYHKPCGYEKPNSYSQVE